MLEDTFVTHTYQTHQNISNDTSVATIPAQIFVC